MKTLPVAAAFLLFAARAAAQTPSFNSTYDASTRTFPDEVCPPWQSIDTAVPESPNLVPTGLLLETSANNENAFYLQINGELDVPDPLVLEFRTRWLSGSTSHVARATIGMGVVVAPNEGILLYVGNNDVFLVSGPGLRGAAAAVNTAQFHTYRLEIHGTGLVEVFYDDAYLLAGSTYSSATDFGPLPRIFWGDITSSAFGRSEWTLVRHDGHAAGCADVDEDGDGVLFEQDCDDQDPSAHPTATEFFDGVDNDCNGLVDEGLDDDGDGVPDFGDLCYDTPAGSGVGPDGCPACDAEPDEDGDGVPASDDCDDSNAAINPGAAETCNGVDDDCSGFADEGFDADADGFTVCASPVVDCDDDDAGVHPEAVELPGNATDEDCDEALTCDPAADWPNHGSFVRCVVNEVLGLLQRGEITLQMAQELVRAAANSDVGKKQKKK